MSNTTPTTPSPPDEFRKIINDFVSDITTTFPEYSGIIGRWWSPETSTDLNRKHKETQIVFKHCLKAFPERFFDVLYENVDIFQEDSEVNTEFLPGIVFKQLWNTNISDHTKSTIWKYLQLVLFAVMPSLRNGSDFGSAEKLFEHIDENELKSKLDETIQGMSTMFESSNASPPSVDEMHSHLNSVMQSRIGRLAMELAEETAHELNLDLNNMSSTKDVFKQMMSNPRKLMSLATKIGSKIDDKIKSGELSETELMNESMEMLKQMKSMPGMENMQHLMQMLGGKGGKLDINAMQNAMQQQMKNMKVKDRLRNKCNKTTATNNNATAASTTAPTVSEEELYKVFNAGDPQQRSARQKQHQNQKQKKKGKK